MRAIEERLRPHLDENVASLWLEKWLQIHAGSHPTVYFSLYRLLRTRKDLTRANPRQASGHRRVPEVWQFVCQEGLHYGARGDVRRNAHRSSSTRSGAGGPGRTVADTHPGAYTKAQRRRTLLGDTRPDIRRPGSQVLSIFLRDRREVPRCLRPGTLRRGYRRLRRDHPTHKRQIRDHVLPVSSRRRERQQTVCRYGGTGQKKVWREVMGAQGSTPRCR